MAKRLRSVNYRPMNNPKGGGGYVSSTDMEPDSDDAKGYRYEPPVEEHHDSAEAAGAHLTKMLQGHEKGKKGKRSMRSVMGAVPMAR